MLGKGQGKTVIGHSTLLSLILFSLLIDTKQAETGWIQPPLGLLSAAVVFPAGQIFKRTVWGLCPTPNLSFCQKPCADC